MTDLVQDRIVIETPAARWQALVGGGLLLTVASAALIVWPSGVFELVAGIVGVVFFGPAAVFLLVRAIRRTPVLVIEASGFTDHATLAGVGFVPWADVHRLHEQVIRGQGMVSVTLRDPASLISRLPVWRRILLRLNRQLITGEVHIPAAALPMPAAQLIATMQSMRHRAAGRH
jgi:hypothetical protein